MKCPPLIPTLAIASCRISNILLSPLTHSLTLINLFCLPLFITHDNNLFADSPFFGLPGGTGYSSRLFDSITIPFFFASSPKLDLMDPNIEIIFSPQPSGSPTPDPVYRKLSPFRGEVFYAEAPFSISESFTLTVISSDRSLRATSPDTIFINVDCEYK